MRKLPLLLLGIAMSACHQSNSPVEKQMSLSLAAEKQSSPALADIFSELKPLLIDAPEVFIVPARTIQTVEGKKGLRILVDAANLETSDGSAVTGDVIVNVKEMQGAADMIANNCPTVSNGKMLVSDGSYFIGMTCNGKELRVKKGRFVQMEFPRSGKTPMELFTGQRDANGVMNWIPVNKKLQANKPIIQSTAQTTITRIIPRISKEEEIRNRIKSNYAEAVKKRTRMRYRESMEWLKQYHDSVIAAREEQANCTFPQMKSHQAQQLINAPVRVPLNSMPYLTIPLTMVNKTTAIHCTMTSIHYFIYGNVKDSIEYYSRYANFKDSAITYTPGMSVDSAADAQDNARSSISYTSNYNTPDYAVEKVKDKEGKEKSEVTYYAPAEIENLGWINCDHFFDAPEGVTPQYTLNIEGNVPDNIGVYIIFKNINSMMLDGVYTLGKKNIVLTKDLPLNTKVEFLFYSKNKDQFMQCKLEALVTKNMVVPVKFSMVPDSQVKKFFMD